MVFQIFFSIFQRRSRNVVKKKQFKCRVLFQPFSKQHHNGKKKCLLENAMEEKIKQILLLRLDLTILQCLNDRIFPFHCCNDDSYLCFVFSSHPTLIRHIENRSALKSTVTAKKCHYFCRVQAQSNVLKILVSQIKFCTTI